MKIEELRIPAPWGHIAAKSWGDSEDFIILVHGYGDNAASFDNLIPLLPICFRYIAIDLPGHGYSTPYHISSPVHMVDFTLALRIVMDHLRKPNYIIICHSLGSMVSILFAMLYPNYVSKLISLDILAPYPLLPYPYGSRLRYQHKLVGENQNTLKRNCYPYEVCVQRVINSRKHGQMTWKAAEPLVKRMTRKTNDDNYYFEFDKRGSGITVYGAPLDFFMEMYDSRPVTCPFMVVLTQDFGMTVAYQEIYNYLKKKNVLTYIVEGHHDVHLTDPERISGYLYAFLISSNKL